MPKKPNNEMSWVDAGSVKLKVGKYAGHSLWWILDEDPIYLDNAMYSNAHSVETRKAIQVYMSATSSKKKLAEALSRI